MSERKEKQRRWQASIKRQPRRMRGLKILGYALLMAGIPCLLASFLLMATHPDAALFPLYAFLGCWTAAAWINWHLEPDGVTTFLARSGFFMVGNRTLAVAISLFAGLVLLILWWGI